MQLCIHEIVDWLSAVGLTGLTFFGKVILLNFTVISSTNKTTLSLLLCDSLRKLKQPTRVSRHTYWEPRRYV